MTDEEIMTVWKSIRNGNNIIVDFARAIIATERERCAKLAEGFDPCGEAQGSFEVLADKIRRGN